jgi:hypothetical protein
VLPIFVTIEQMEHIDRLEDNPCCDNIWKNGMSGLTDVEIYYFCNNTPPPPKSKFFYLIYPYFNLMKNNVCVVPSCLDRLGVTYGSNFLLDYEVKIWHLIN